MPEESTEKQVGGSLQPDCSAEASSINTTCQQCGEDCGILQEVRDRARTPERMDNTLDIRTADAPPGSLERLVRARTERHKRMKIEEEIIADKELRRDTDAIIQRVKALPPSRERSLTITKLQEGVMWLGMDLKRINETTPGSIEDPYPNSKDPSNTKIEPTADGLKL